jgi:type I restriction enzyme S subunit
LISRLPFWKKSGNLPSIVEMPKGWELKPLKSCVRFIEGPGILAEDFVDDGIPLLRIGSIGGRTATLEGCNYLSADLVEKKWKHFRLRTGDLLISGSASTGFCSEVDEKTAGSIPYTGIIIIRPCEQNIDKNFIRWFFLSYEFLTQAELARTGSAIQHFGPTHLSQMRVVIPSLFQQRRIGEYLDEETARLDGLVAAKSRVLALLAEKRRALVTRAVTRGLDPQVPLRNSGIPWLGEIPANWKTRRAAWLFRERDERGEPDLPLLEVSINSGVILREFSDDRIESTASDFNTYKVARKGDIVFNKMRMWQGAVGVAPEDGLVSPDYTVAAPSLDLSSDYAGQLFRTEQFSAECARRSHGIVWDRLRLYWEGFRDIALPLPPQPEQLAILSHIRKETGKLDALRAATERMIALLKERRAALIAAAVTGQIAVPEANKTRMECQNAI